MSSATLGVPFLALPINAQCTDLYFPCNSCLKWIVILLLMRVIHLRLFDGYFISPKYLLYKRINSRKLDPLTKSESPVVREGAIRVRPEEDEISDWAALQRVLEWNSHQALGVLQSEVQVHFGVQR